MTSILKLKNYTAIILLICLVGCSPAIIYQSSWQSTPVVADGVANEWKIPLRFYDPDTKLNYTISNDKKNLYVCIRATDEGTQVKIMRAGMHVWIDTTGKKNKQIGIFFPMLNAGKNGSSKSKGSHSYSSGSGDNTMDKPSVESVHRSFLTQATEMLLTGFKPPIGGLTSLANDYGIKVGMNWDSSDILIYEAIIPFKTFSSPVVDTSKTISVSVALDALPTEGNSDSGHGEHGGGGGGGMGSGGMGGGGGMHGGGGGRSYGSSNDEKSGLYSSQNFWVKIHLVSK